MSEEKKNESTAPKKTASADSAKKHSSKKHSSDTKKSSGTKKKHSAHSHSKKHSKHSSHKHHTESDDQDLKTLRNIFAFLLFGFVLITSISGCFKFSLLDADRVAGVFTNREYVYALYTDVLQYADDLSEQCGVPKETVDSTVTYSRVEDIQKAYTEGILAINKEYAEDAYADKIEKLGEDIYDATKSTLKEHRVQGYSDASLHLYADKIADYMRDKVQFEYMDVVQSLLNLGGTVSSVVFFIAAIISVALALVVISVGEDFYRNVRSLCHSFLAAAAVHLLLYLAYLLVRATKELIVYPSYLCRALLQYCDASALAVLAAGGILFLCTVITAAVVWKMKAADLDNE